MLESLEDRSLLAAVEVPSNEWRNAEFEIGEAMVRFNDNVTQAQAQQQLFNSAGATITTWWSELHMAHVRLPNIMNRDAQINQIKNIHDWDSVYYAEPNFILHPSLTPNDPIYPEQWGLHNTGQTVGPQPPLAPPPFGSSLPSGTIDADIDAPEAWDVTTGDPNTIIAIIDTGVDYRHPDLEANIWENPGEIAGDLVDNDGNGFIDDLRGWDFADNDNDTDDEDGHGTHVAGIAAGVGNNALGIAGVSFRSKILAIRAGNPTFSSSAIVGSQLYIAKMRGAFGFNIVVSNNSYGGFVPFSFAQYDGIRIANDAGIPFIAAAGNSASNNDTLAAYPANFNLPGVVSVAATENTDTLATFSQYGQNTVHVAAPGVGIWSTVPTNIALPISDPSGYAILDGTSMASPMVAGIVGLMRSFDPTISNSQIKSFLIQGVDTIPSLRTRVFAGGRVNAARSLDLIPRNEIKGAVFLDNNQNTTFDPSESGLGGWTVYMDRNNNAVLDSGEPRTLSQANGSYNLRGIFGAGTYIIRQIVQPTYRQTFPANNAGHSVTLQSRYTIVNGVNFGNQEIPGEVHGHKWNDLDGDGIEDAGEPRIQGVIIYVDMNNDLKIGVGEPAAVTDRFGNYTIKNVPPGTWTIREVYQPGFIQTFPDPAGPDAGGVSGVVVVRGRITGNINFGNQAAFDYGDAPIPYPTTILANGAVHGFLQNFGLGTVDAESNGIPSTDADGDDLDNTDDEDGVSIPILVPGESPSITGTASTGSFAAGYMNAWIDWNGDGDWNDSGERVFTDVQLTTGAFSRAVTVPANATKGVSYARFRFSLDRGIGPTGSALGGEVEDHQVFILGDEPVARNDSFTVNQDSFFFQNQFDVLANDLPSRFGPPEIDDFGPTAVPGSEVRLNDQGTSDPYDDVLEYQPAPGYIGEDSFTYQVRDPNGNISNRATVTIDVLFVPRDPIAVDDTFDVAVGSTGSDAANQFHVLDNDVGGTGGPISIDSNTDATFGTVVFDNNNTPLNPADDFYRYTPPAPATPGFLGSDSFTYTITDTDGNRSTATVWIQVGPPSNDRIRYALQVLDSTGAVIPDSQLLQTGQVIYVRGIVQDLFPTPIDPDNMGDDFRGAEAAYMDLLYPRGLVQSGAQSIQFGPRYQAGTSGSGGIPGLINEVGAFHSDLNQLGPGIFEVFRKQFVIRNRGFLTFVADPADVRSDVPPNDPAHDILAYDPNTDQVDPVLPPNVFYVKSPTYEIILNSEGEFTNLRNPLDVNNDTFVSAIDALLVINNINAGNQSGASGEAYDGPYMDVNHDNAISAIDALLVINNLNRQPQGGGGASGEAEGEAEDPTYAYSGPAESGGASTESTDDTSTYSTASYASGVDAVLSGDWSSATTSKSTDEEYVAWSESKATDEYFAELGNSILSRRARKR